MTKTGHTHARRALVEGAWASRYPAQGSRHLPRRLEQLPTAIQAISWKAQVRLGTRYRHLMATGKHAHQVVVAIARALRAFMWAIAKQVAGSPKASRGRRVDTQVRGFHPLSAETQPRCGVTLGGVMRPTGPLVPRLRQAPDGGKEGGSQPTESSVITRRVFLVPALPRDETKGKNMRQTSKSGSQPLTSEVISTPGLSCCRKRERRRSVRWRQSGYSRRGNRSPRLCFKTVRASFPAHGSSVIYPLSWAPCWACDLHVGASPVRVIPTSLTGVLTASAALLVPITSLPPSPRQPLHGLSPRPALLGESHPMSSAVDTCSSWSTTEGYSVPYLRGTLHEGPHSSPGFSGVSLGQLHTCPALLRALLAQANTPRRLAPAHDDSVMGSCAYP
jgi:hypothetical protein